MLPRVLFIIGLILLLAGLGSIGSRVSFLSRAQLVDAVVVQSEIYRGPPRGPRSIPLRVRYTFPDGTVQEADTASPFLKVLEPGSKVQVLVDNSQPPVVKLPILSELWTVPLALLVAGFGLIFVGWAAARVRKTR